jgi:16S rRNA (guanine527-N7)-methyltransferase
LQIISSGRPLNAIDTLRAPLLAALNRMQLPDDDLRVGRWLDYLALLERWNRAYNLTAIRDPAEMLTRHLLDSLAMAPYWTESEIGDMGAGAGLPGLPLAILHAERRVVLIESNGKKARFLREVQRTLKLGAVEVIEARAEAYAPPRPLAAATARAVAPIAALGGWCQSWLAEGGRLLAMKGPGYREELSALPAGFVLDSVADLSVPGLEGERVLVILRKS